MSSLLLKVGDRVCASAILFDEKGSKTLWSKTVFGKDYKTAVCHGTIINIIQDKKATVLWDIDGLRMAAKLNQLRKSNEQQNATSNADCASLDPHDFVESPSESFIDDDASNKTTSASSSDSKDTEYVLEEATSDIESASTGPETSSGSETAECVPNAGDDLSNLKKTALKQIDRQTKHVDKKIVKFGEIAEETPSEDIEHYTNWRPWTKKNACPYCFQEITHFSRHLQRNHKEEGAVKQFLALSTEDAKRKQILNLIRRQGNFMYSNHSNVVKPVRRPRNVKSAAKRFGNVDKKKDDPNPPPPPPPPPLQENEKYVTCPDCFGFFKRNFLRRHRKNCKIKEKSGCRSNHLSEAQLFKICKGRFSNFYNSLRLKNEVFTIMRADKISQTAMKDVLICSYAESLLKKHKRTQIRTTISNKMRELGRLLINLKEIIRIENLFDALKPELFDDIVTATKIISGYNAHTKTYKAASLALHMGTTLKQVCDIATNMIIKNNRFLPHDDKEVSLKNIKRLKYLLVNNWNSEISSLALKDLNEKRWEKPKLFPLTSNVIKFQQYLMTNAKQASIKVKEASNKIVQREELDREYRRLTEIVLCLTLLLNRKRIGEVQYLKVKTYNDESSFNTQQELLETLSDSEKILTQNFKRVVTGGKGSRPVAILFPKEIQNFIELLLSVRDICVNKTNEYLFANPKTNNRWLGGYGVLQKLAKQSGVEDTRLFTSTRLRKQIATVLQVINITDNEIEQFAAFMGHTKKTHETYYRLPQDVYQTAKVSKLLLAINKGKITEYKGKSLNEIELSDNAETDDSDNNQDSSDTEQDECQKQQMSPSSNVDRGEPSKERTKNKKVLPSGGGVRKPAAIQQECEPSISRKEDETSIEVKKRKIQRIKWSNTQKKALKRHFSDHIKEKKVPKKAEVEKLIVANKKLFADRNWITMKAFVYNCFK